MTLRRLFVLVRGLPPDSRLKIELAAEALQLQADIKTDRLEARQERYQPNEPQPLSP